jgi:hypothetical protein
MDGPRTPPATYIDIELQKEGSGAPCAMTQIKGAWAPGIKLIEE